jgi:hypothetical protein
MSERAQGQLKRPPAQSLLAEVGAWWAYPANDARSHPTAVPTSAARRPAIVVESGKLPQILMHGSMLPMVGARWLIVMNGGIDSRRMRA